MVFGSSSRKFYMKFKSLSIKFKDLSFIHIIITKYYIFKLFKTLKSMPSFFSIHVLNTWAKYVHEKMVDYTIPLNEKIKSMAINNFKATKKETSL